MSVDHLHPEYPEHLNPFRRSTNTITRSFRGIKKAILRSFTGKDKERPVIRPKQGTEPTNRAVFSMPPDFKETPIAFPRSRFSERLSKTDAIRASTTKKRTILGDPNPFEEGIENETKAKNHSIEDETLTAPKPIARSKHKKRKNKAPVPPASVGGSVGGSKWSLNSTESDMSSMYCYSETEIDYIDRSAGDNEEILSLTRQIAKFTEDTNNNSIAKDGEKSNENQSTSERNPQLNENINPSKSETDNSYTTPIQVEAVSPESKMEEAKPSSSGLNSNPQVFEETKPSSSELNSNPQVFEETKPSPSQLHSNPQVFEETKPFSPELNSNPQVSEETKPFSPELNSNPQVSKETKPFSPELNSNPQVFEETKPSSSGLNSNPQIFEETKPSSPKLNSNPQIFEETKPSSSELNSNPQIFEETKPSSSELNSNPQIFKETVTDENSLKLKDCEKEDRIDTLNKSLSVEENVEEKVDSNSVEATERRVSVKGTIEFFETSTPSPTPKVRKNILTKENLLGSDAV